MASSHRDGEPTTRDRLVQRVAARLAESGLAGTGLRELAAAAGVSHRTLLYHFGTRDALILEALGAMRALQAEMVEVAWSDAASRPAAFDLARGVWKNISADESADWFRLFFEVYASCLRDPEANTDFLEAVTVQWVELIETIFAEEHPTLAGNDSATLLLATLRGLHLDLLATGDRARVERALDTLLALFERASAEARRGARDRPNESRP